MLSAGTLLPTSTPSVLDRHDKPVTHFDKHDEGATMPTQTRAENDADFDAIDKDRDDNPDHAEHLLFNNTAIWRQMPKGLSKIWWIDEVIPAVLPSKQR